MSAVADKLRKARALIERGWTQGEYARGKRGTGVDAQGKAAVCFCAIGAIRRASFWEEHRLAQPLQQVIGAQNLGGVFDWNDAPERTQADVLAAFDKAIELTESGQ